MRYLLPVFVLMTLSLQAHARCTNVSGNPSADAYCSVLQEDICKPEYTGGQCQNIVIPRCTNVGGDPIDNTYCSILEPEVCKLEYTGNKCMLVVN